MRYVAPQITALLAFIVTACAAHPAKHPTEAGPATNKNAILKLPFPYEIQAIVDHAVLPHDQPKMFRRGEFKIEPSTLFCFSYEHYVDEELKKLGVMGVGLAGEDLNHSLEAIEQTSLFEGMVRTPSTKSTRCQPGGSSNPIYLQSYSGKNSQGGYYRIVSAMWQGDAYVVLGIERKNEGPRPEIFNPYGTDPMPIEIGADAKIISKAFADKIAKQGTSDAQ